MDVALAPVASRVMRARMMRSPDGDLNLAPVTRGAILDWLDGNHRILHLGARPHGGIADERVEPQAGQTQKFTGERDRAPVGHVDAQRTELEGLAAHGGAQAHGVERGERIGDEGIAAGLVTREGLAIDQRHARRRAQAPTRPLRRPGRPRSPMRHTWTSRSRATILRAQWQKGLRTACPEQGRGAKVRAAAGAEKKTADRLPRATSKGLPRATSRGKGPRRGEQTAPRPAGSGLAPGMQAVNSYLAVANVAASMEFLERAFGFTRGVVLPETDGQLRYAEMRHPTP